MKETYRVRDGRIVQLRTEELLELYETASCIVDIDDMTVELVLDKDRVAVTGDCDHTLTLSPNAPDALFSGFVRRFFSVLDDQDLVLMAEQRPEYEIQVRDNDGYMEPSVTEPRRVTVGDVETEVE